MYGRLGAKPPLLPVDSMLVSIQLRTVAPQPLDGSDEDTSTGKYMIEVAKITGMTPAMLTFSGM